MSAGRYRGVFWAPEGEGDPVPGVLEISDSGALRVELQGQIFEGRRVFDRPKEAIRIEGEIADSPFRGPSVTLFRCLLTRRTSGPGGPLEKWLAHRALIGHAAVESDASFDRVSIDIRGLGAFIEENPSPFCFEGDAIRIPVLQTEVERLTVGDWKVVFGWQASSHAGPTSFRVEKTPFIQIDLERPLSVDEVLGNVVPVFEGILTIALREHARIEQITVSSSRGHEAYRVLGPRVEAPDPAAREPDEAELLFHLSDATRRHSIIEQLRQLFSHHPEFTAIFLGHERVPPRYLEDRVRVSVLTLAHLTPLFPGVSERARELTTPLKNAPAQVRVFLPSAALVAVPELARELLTPNICEALGVSSKETLVEGIGPAFRWATLREGTQASGDDLLRLSHQLRDLVHLSLLRILGFELEEAEQRMVRSLKQRGLTV